MLTLLIRVYIILFINNDFVDLQSFACSVIFHAFASVISFFIKCIFFTFAQKSPANTMLMYSVGLFGLSNYLHPYFVCVCAAKALTNLHKCRFIWPSFCSSNSNTVKLVA